MRFTIITPGLNQLGWLKRCVASVASQATEGVGHEALGAGAKQALGVGAKQALGVRRWASGKGSSESMIRVHHHIQDAQSSDGTVEFLKEHQQVVSCQRSAVSQGVAETPKAECRMPNTYSFSFQSERDDGMYDGINRGVERAIDGAWHKALGDKDMAVVARQGASGIGQQVLGTGGESGIRHQALGTGEALSKNTQHPTPNVQRLSDDSVVAWLNCDEQYLPGTLKKVSDFFLANPSVDILFGGMLIVDEAGELLSCRKAMPMRKLFLEASYLYNFSCAMFFRRSAWEQLGGFDTSFKNAGDEELIRRAMTMGLKTAVLKDYLSVFTYSQMNLSSGGSALEEHEKLKKTGSWMSRSFRLPINLFRLTEKALRGGLVQRGPVEYDIYTDDLTARTHFKVQKPSCRWPDNNQPYLFKHRLDGR